MKKTIAGAKKCPYYSFTVQKKLNQNFKGKNIMRLLNLSETADFLETATIEKTIDNGHAIIHTGTNQSGSRFVLMNNTEGETVLTEAL